MIGIGLFIAVFVATVNATSICALYATPAVQLTAFPGANWNESTLKLVAFFDGLLKRGTLDEADLIKMREQILHGELANPFWRQGCSAIENDLFSNLVKELSTPQVNTAHVLVWVDNELQARGKEQVRREERQTETRIPFREMQLFRVESGEFKMGEGKIKKEVVLPHPFEAMSTAVTQSMWVMEFGENPSHFAIGEHTVEVVTYRKTIQMQPDNPVENITWWSMIEYANRVTRRMGLEPAFDLSKIDFDPRTSAAKGTLKPLDGQTITDEMLINHPSGNIYKTEGLRPLTEAEWEYLVRDRGRSKTIWHSGDNESDLQKVAWYQGYADQKTHPVAQLDPLVVDGKLFFDLHGNVSEWVWDRISKPVNRRMDPALCPTIFANIQRGGGWNTNAYFCRSARRYVVYPEDPIHNPGARLGRTVR